MNYEIAYKEALERARKEYKTHESFNGFRVMLLNIFPELEETDDERIRKSIIGFLITISSLKDGMTVSNEDFDSKVILEWVSWLEKQESVDEIVKRCKTSWYNEGKIQGKVEGLSDDEKYQQGWHDALEKQGEQKPTIQPKFKVGEKIIEKDFDECGCGTIIDIKDGKYIFDDGSFIWIKEQDLWELVDEKSYDKTETKFNVGDWVVFNNQPEKGSIYQVEKIENFQYTLRHILGGSMPLSYSKENMLRLWTVDDAKEGDVLCYKDEISLYKHNIKNHTKFFSGFIYHCCYDGKRFITNSFYSLIEQDKMDIHPATKEQRDLLFQKIKEAGYKWDSEKKELIRIP